MAVGSCAAVGLLVLVLLWTVDGGGAEVCIVRKSCILPCSFQPGKDVVIHWILENKDSTAVHSYFYGEDQLARQDQSFRGRTSLFKDQISRGNASLRLTDVAVQDRRTYKCYTSSNSGSKESLISLSVEAPVSKVDIQQEGNWITCRSEGIYPEPDLSWSTSPPSTVTPEGEPSVQRTEQQLYSISSSVMLSDKDLVYSCTVSTRSSWKTASFFRQAPITFSTDDETTIACSSSNTLPELTWRFNHSQVILRRSGPDAPDVSEGWRKHVRSLSQSGSLTLQDLSRKEDGLYTCELSDGKETHFTSTFLRAEESPVSDARDAAGVAVGVLVALIAALIAIVLLCKYRNPICRCLQNTPSQEASDQNHQSEQLKALNAGSNGGAAV